MSTVSDVSVVSSVNVVKPEEVPPIGSLVGLQQKANAFGVQLPFGNAEPVAERGMALAKGYGDMLPVSEEGLAFGEVEFGKAGLPEGRREGFVMSCAIAYEVSARFGITRAKVRDAREAKSAKGFIAALGLDGTVQAPSPRAPRTATAPATTSTPAAAPMSRQPEPVKAPAVFAPLVALKAQLDGLKAEIATAEAAIAGVLAAFPAAAPALQAQLDQKKAASSVAAHKAVADYLAACEAEAASLLDGLVVIAPEAEAPIVTETPAETPAVSETPAEEPAKGKARR
jgi:hypothetical protein